MLSKVAILVCVSACNVLHSFSFQVGLPTGSRDLSEKFTRGIKVEAVADEVSDETSSAEPKGDTRLRFGGEITVTTNPLPSVPKDQIAAFFKAPENRNLLATAGGKRQCEEVEVTPQLLEDWKRACDVVGSEYPDENDSIISVRTGGIEFPGLSLVSLAKIGIKIIDEPSLRIEFTMIGDEQTVTGLPPVVWIFNKLTGAEGKDGTSTRSLTVVKYSQTKDWETLFTSDVSLQIMVKFPAILLKILPTNKQKTEETGGKAITKTVTKDVQEGMYAYEEAYLKWIS